MLDEDLDSIGKFVHLDQEFVHRGKILDLPDPKLNFYEVGLKTPAMTVSRVDAESIDLLEGLFRKYLERFGYELPAEGHEFQSLWSM